MSVYRVGTNKSSTNVFPSVRPTLDLDFANSKTLDPRITFTRASGGSYVGADGLIKYAGVNEARFDHNPVTGESLGLLIEEVRTNLALDGTTFANPNWLKSKINLDTFSVLSPDNTLTAAKMYPNTESGQHNIVRTITGLSDNTVYTSSIFIKKFGGFPWCRLSLRSKNGTFTGVYFNYDTKTFGTVITTGELVNYGYQEYPNGWIRLYIVTNVSTGAIPPTFHFWIAASNAVLDFDYTGGNSDGYYIWGAQLEQGFFPSSYIPTQSSIRTRAEDNAVITGKNFSDFFNPNEGSFIVDVSSPPSYKFTSQYWRLSSSSGQEIFGLDNNVNPSPTSGGTSQIYVAQDPQLTQGFVYSGKDYRSNILVSYSDDYILGIVNARSKFRELFNNQNLPDKNIPTFNLLRKFPRNFSRLSIGIGSDVKVIKKLTYYPKQLTYEQSIVLSRL